MSAIVAYADGVVAVVQRDWRLFKSYRTRALATLANAFFSLTLFYYLSRLVTVQSFGSADAYFAFVVIGIVILAVFQSTVSISGALRGELLMGTFERMVVAPLGAMTSIVAMMVFPLLMALTSGVASLVFATLVFDMSVQWETAVLALPIGVLGALSFAPFGVLLAASVVVLKQSVSGVGWVVALMSLVSGVYFPPALLPDWIEWTSSAQPFTPAVDLMRHLLVGTPTSDPAAVQLLTIVGFAVVLLPLSLVALSAALRHAQRRGTITEY